MTNDHQNSKEVKSMGPTWRFYVLWVFANAIGTIVGTVVFFFLVAALGLLGMPLPEQHTHLQAVGKLIVVISIISVPFGSIIGGIQWLMLRKYLRHSGIWFVTSAMAMLIGNTISAVLPSSVQWLQRSSLFLSWFFFGGVSGALQWIIMRNQLHHSGLWILANVIAGSVAGIFAPDLGIIGGSLGWALAGIITGGVMFVLLQKAKKLSDAPIVASLL